MEMRGEKSENRWDERHHFWFLKTTARWTIFNYPFWVQKLFLSLETKVIIIILTILKNKLLLASGSAAADLADLCHCKLLFGGDLVVHFFVSLQQLYRPITICLIFNPISFTYVAAQSSFMCYPHGKCDFIITGML